MDRKPACSPKLAVEVGNRKEGKDQSGLVWRRKSTFCSSFLYWLARRSVIAQIMKLHFEGCSNMPRSEVGFIKEMNGTLLTVRAA